MPNPQLHGRVRFFAKARKVIFIGLLKKAGELVLNAGGKVVVHTASGDTTLPITDNWSLHKIPIGTNLGNHLVVLVADFDNYTPRLTTDDKGVPIIALSAQLQVTITNDPPGPDAPTSYDVDETETSPGDDPTEP